MNKILKIFLPLLPASAVLIASPAYTASPKDPKISIWKRKPGLHSDNQITGKIEDTTIELKPSKDLLIKAARVTDIHYGKRSAYRGFLLSDVLKNYQKSHPLKSEDAVLLHFQNKMIIPLKLSLASDDKIKILIALETRGSKKSPWSHKFSPVSKKDDLYRDPRPLNFTENKIVINKKTEALLTTQMNQPFSPWLYANSLIGIEYINLKAYNDQFELSNTLEIKSGAAVFLRRCQYCHSIRYVGARYGWDFVEPIPIYKKRLKKDLHYHVKYPKAFALQQGLMMPNQLGFTEKEASDLWTWLKAADKNKPKAYKVD